MLRNVMRSGLVGALLGILSLATVAQAADFNTLLAQAAALNQTYISQIDSALAAPDLATTQARTSTALATGNQLVSVLNSAVTAATNDADRSRAQGLLGHINAAQASGQRALTSTSLNTARSNLNAMRAEAVEAQTEFPPVVTVTPTPTVMPPTGGPGPAELPVVAAAGLALALGGLGLRLVRLA
jgi:hypothetical protein